MKRKVERPEGLVEISQLLEGALRKLGVKGDWDRRRLEERCREWLKEASSALVRVEEKQGTVTLFFDHSAFLQEFGFLREEGLKMLKKEFPKMGIRDLKAALSAEKGRRE